MSQTIVSEGQVRAAVRCVLATLVPLACVAALLATASSASAADHRGHVFGFQFGEGAGAHALEEPVAVAIDEATGQLYVADRVAKQVDRYQCPKSQEELEDAATRSCTFLSSFPTGTPEAIAVDSSTSAEDPSAGDVYVAAGKVVLKYTPEGQEIDKIKEFGEELKLEEKEKILGVAVDAQGNLWVDYGQEEEGYIATFDDAQPNVLTQESFESDLQQPFEERAAPLRRGLAVDSADDVLVGYEDTEVEHKKHCTVVPCQVGELLTPQAFLAEGQEADEEAEVEPGEALREAFGSQNATGVAVDPGQGNEVYVDDETSVGAYTENGVLLQRFGEGHLQGGADLAVDADSDGVYVPDVQQHDIQVYVPTPPGEPSIVSEGASEVNPANGTATLEAVVDPSGAPTTYRFEYGSTSAYGNVVSEQELAPSFEAKRVAASVSGLSAGGVYHFRVVVDNGHGGAVAGTDSLFSEQSGLIDGRQWEMVSPAQKSGASVLPIGGFESANQGLAHGSVLGNAISYTTDIPVEAAASTNRAPERAQQLATRGPNGWSSQEITAPVNVKGGFTGPGEPPEYRFFSEDLALSLVVPFRHPKEFSEERFAEPPLSPPAKYARHTEAGEAPEYVEEEASQQEKTIYLRQDAPLSPESAEEPLEATAYKEAEAQSGFVALLTQADVMPGAEFGGAGPAVRFVDATSDLAHVLLESTVTLASSGTPGLYEWNAGQSSHTVEHEGKEYVVAKELPEVSVLPDGQPAGGFSWVGQGRNMRDAISANGSRVAWENGTSRETHNASTHLYVRQMLPQTLDQAGQSVTTPAQTVEIGESVIGTPIKAKTGPVFQDASSDGSKIFFTDEQKLTPGSGAENGKPELYVCELVSGEGGKLGCKTTDLSQLHEGEHGDVEGVVLGISEKGCDEGSEEGCDVYFVANGTAGTDASPGDCVHESPQNAWTGRTCNLFERRCVVKASERPCEWLAPTLVATLANGDRPDWSSNQTSGGLEDNLGHVTARVSPNGNWLAFMSMEPLTGYDSLDAKTGARDEEVFLYDAAAHRLVCASCNPDGAQPEGIEDSEQVAEEEDQGPSLLIDHNGIWLKDAELFHEPIGLAGSIPGWSAFSDEEARQQSRYLNDEGRLFFDAAGGLVSEDTNGRADVYEYEPEGLGGCSNASSTSTQAFVPKASGCVALVSSGKAGRESAFVEASESGADAFFITDQPLSRSDHDTNYDLYDAHECTASSPCPPEAAEPPAPCASEQACKGALPAAPSVGGSPTGSATASGPGNLTPSSGVLSSQTTGKPTSTPKPTKPLTRAQKLDRALKACKKDKQKKARQKCEKQAHAKYGPKPKKKKSKK